VILAFVAAEDARFFEHEGLDFKGIARAFIKNMLAGHIIQGGSTITQQVAKSLFLTPEKSYTRKLKEAILAYRIDRYLKKYEILNLYLNQIYLGHGTYGVETAARKYFGKSADELTLSEAALLAGLPKAPSRYSPFQNPKYARMRQLYVLKQMKGNGFISEEEEAEAVTVPVELNEQKDVGKTAPYFTENIRRYIQAQYTSEVLYREGLTVFSTLDVRLQQAAAHALDRGLRELDRRAGYRGPLAHVASAEADALLAELTKEIGDAPLERDRIVKALVTGVNAAGKTVAVKMGHHRGVMALADMAWARRAGTALDSATAVVANPASVLRKGDEILVRILETPGASTPWSPEGNVTAGDDIYQVALEQEPEVQGALLCMEAATGRILAMVGGRDFKASEFNRATQARRQPGSAFKPFIYTAAFERGMTPSTVVIDSPVIYEDSLRDSTWKPQNFDEKFYGPTILETALVKSRNVVTIKVLKDIGVGYAAECAARMGITSPLSRDLSMALGTSAVTLVEMVRGFGVLAGNGIRVEPFSIDKILDRTGSVLEERRPGVEQVIDARVAYVTSHILQEVVLRGTGWRLKELGRPVAGKTGTTNELRDAWFVGYTPSIVAGVWVGYDDQREMSRYETGSRAASPIILYFFQEALDGTPVEYFTPPPGVVFVKIDPDTGLLARPEAENAVMGCYIEGTEPTRYAPVGTSARRWNDKDDLDSFMRREMEEGPQ
jgi:penicillin-binding protein 1A